MKKTLKALAVSTLFAATASQATLLSFDLNHNFGTVDAGGNVAVSITEAATAGDVHISISNFTLGFLNDLFLNYSPNSDIAGGTISNFSATSGIVGSPSIHYDGSQGFAIVFDFPQVQGPNRFTNGESASFDLSATTDLTVMGFDHLGGKPVGDDYYAVAHVNDVAVHGDCGGGSAKIGDINGGNVSGGALDYGCGETPGGDPLPEPATILLMGMGLLGLACRGRKSH